MTTTAPRRKSSTRWNLGDLMTIDGIRWVIRRLDRATGRVELESMNTTNHGGWWRTTVDKLPEKKR